MNIYEELEKYFKKKKLESKEIKKIPKDFHLDLNELDYQKYKDTKPREYPSIMFSACIGYIKFMLGIFIMYAISDFMDYSLVKNLLLELWNSGIFVNIFIFIFAGGFLLDLLLILMPENSTSKHKLFWYNKLKKYK